MIRFLLFSIFLSGQFAFGQSKTQISKITFRYDKGHYTFGSSGHYSISEILEYTKSNNEIFKLTKYIQLKNYYDSATNSISVDTIRLKSSKIPISNDKAEKLFSELNISRDNFNKDYVKPFLSSPTKKEILKTAEKYNLKWMFENKYSDRKARKELYNNIRKFSLLDTFLLIKKPNPEYGLIITDVWNGLFITCVNTTDTIEYQSQYFLLFGQPVKKYMNQKYSDGKKIINLKINNAIKEFVPANSLISKIVDLNQLKDEYISWFIQTQM